MIAQAPEALMATDADGTIVFWNRAAEHLLGIPTAQALGRPMQLIDSPAIAPNQLGTAVQRVLAGGAPEQVEITSRAATGRPLHVTVSIAALRERQAGVFGACLLAREASDNERIQEALREATRRKDEFLAIMSHELRTPLTSILGYTDMLLRGLSGPLAPLANRYLGNVRAAGDRLLELVNGLLDYTRLEAGAEHLDLAPTDLVTLAAREVERFQPHARDKSIDLSFTSEPGLDAVTADHEKLGQVLRSFITNALKFTRAPGTIVVRVGRDPSAADHVRVSVSDSGIGLRDEQLDRVWERFYQGDASLTRAHGGMGLGLSIARHLVALHGGSVGAESRGPGLGSTFWFSLRRRDAR